MSSPNIEGRKKLIDRRTVLASAVAASAVGVAARSAPLPDTPPNDELQTWIDRNAVGVRTVDAADDDFGDLEFLVDVIGSAKVVQLGEASHGVGNGFAAKARLVRFLHQRMGFDVLVWEEGIYDVRLIQAGLRGPADILSVTQPGIRDGWSNSDQVKPLFEYARASLRTIRPLEMAGYDSRFSKPSVASFGADVRSFVTALRDTSARQRLLGLTDRALAAHYRICFEDDLPMGRQEDLAALWRAFDVLLDEMRGHRTALEKVYGARETAFMVLVVESLRSDGTGNFYLKQVKPGAADLAEKFGKFWHQRDQQGARNFRGLIEEQYPGRKIMFWAHNVHVMNAYCGLMFKGIHLEAQPDDMKPVGVYLADWLGDDIYAMGMAHYDGAEGLTGNRDAKPLPLAPQGSLEARLHALEQPYLFLDFRALDATPAHPLRKPQAVRVITPSHETVADITRVFDGIFYIDRATPATPARGPALGL